MGRRRALALRHAVALGLLHGPTELLPISSSAHTSLVPWLAGWPYGKLDAELRKSFEVALHAGTATALLACPPYVPLGGRPSFLISALVPPALAGYTLGGQVERRLGTPATIAAGLLAGSVAMGVAEMCAHDARPVQDAGWRDGLALGLAQSLALFPGVSRSGATLTAARARGFAHLDADRLSWHTGLPLIAGAAALRGSQLTQSGIPREMRLPLAVGAVGALLSTLASATLLTPRRRVRLLPACVLYRGMLALLVIRRMRDNTRQHAPTIKNKTLTHTPGS